MSDSPATPSIPAIVDAAGRFVACAWQDRMRPISYDPPAPAEPLNPLEKRTYHAALEVLRNYFSGENAYGDAGAGRVTEDEAAPSERRNEKELAC